MGWSGRVLRRFQKFLVITELGNVHTVLSKWAMNINRYHSLTRYFTVFLRANCYTYTHDGLCLKWRVIWTPSNPLAFLVLLFR